MYDGYSWQSRTGEGPASLSDLREVLKSVREQGYAHEQGTTTSGIDCIASPVLTRDRRAVAALGVAYMSATKSAAQATEMAKIVVATAGQFSESFGARIDESHRDQDALGIA
jgi:DNA-binding IclR family transcriptional regulator